MIRIRRSLFFGQICGWSQYVTVSHGTSEGPCHGAGSASFIDAPSLAPRDRAGEHNETTTSETPNSDPPSAAVRSHCERSCEEMRTDANSVIQVDSNHQDLDIHSCGSLKRRVPLVKIPFDLRIFLRVTTLTARQQHLQVWESTVFSSDSNVPGFT